MAIAREAWPWVALCCGIGLAAAALHPLFAVPGLLAAGFVLWFFRDPERVAPDEAGIAVSPADGRVLRAGPQSISIFMNVFDVHVCRSPLAADVESLEHRSGRFLAAYRDDAAERNECVTLLLRDGEQVLRCALVAGLVARRIVPRVRPGQRLARGERIGLIQFGSRVDVELPPGAEVAVRRGQRVTAGVSVIARLPHPHSGVF